MKTIKVVKLANFNSLLRIDKYKNKIEPYQKLSENILKIIKELIYSKNINLDKSELFRNSTKPKLNIYIGNDKGLCRNFNKEIIERINENKSDYKIIIGKKIMYNDELTLINLESDRIEKKIIEIERIINDGFRKMKFSEINLFYIDYHNYTDYHLNQIELFPFELDAKDFDGQEFVSKTEIVDVIKGLMTMYICYQICMAVYSSKVSENIERKKTTDYSLKRIKMDVKGV